MPIHIFRQAVLCSRTITSRIVIALAVSGAFACSNHPTKPSTPSGPAVPTITTQPASEGLTMGQGASLFVVASSPTPISYQWYAGQSGDSSMPIAGATEWIYNTPNLLVTSAYWVRVSNAGGGVNSNTATIDVRNVVTPAGDPFEDQLLALINQQRGVGATCGSASFGPVPALWFDLNLQAAARLHSQDMAINHFFSHTSLDGRTFTQRIRNAGYAFSPLAENIAEGYTTPQMVFDGWMSSPGHCTNIMSSAYLAVGIGYAVSPGGSTGPYWTADFGGGQ